MTLNDLEGYFGDPFSKFFNFPTSLKHTKLRSLNFVHG